MTCLFRLNLLCCSIISDLVVPPIQCVRPSSDRTRSYMLILRICKSDKGPCQLIGTKLGLKKRGLGLQRSFNRSMIEPFSLLLRTPQSLFCLVEVASFSVPLPFRMLTSARSNGSKGPPCQDLQTTSQDPKPQIRVALPPPHNAHLIPCGGSSKENWNVRSREDGSGTLGATPQRRAIRHLKSIGRYSALLDAACVPDQRREWLRRTAT